MSEVVWLVDFENVQKFDLAQLPSDTRVKVFVGAKQPRLPTEIVKLREELGDRFKWVWIDGTGSNALDFFIACYLGEALAHKSQAEFVVLSGDAGFDPLLRHLNKNGLRCKRAVPAFQTKPEAKTELDAHAEQVIEALRGIEKNKRPRKRATLTNYLVTHFGKKLSAGQVSGAINRLVKAKLIAGSDAALVYQF